MDLSNIRLDLLSYFSFQYIQYIPRLPRYIRKYVYNIEICIILQTWALLQLDISGIDRRQKTYPIFIHIFLPQLQISYDSSAKFYSLWKIPLKYLSFATTLHHNARSLIFMKHFFFFFIIFQKEIALIKMGFEIS